jgi:hypothetical protein
VIDAFVGRECQELNMDFFIGYNWPLSAGTARVLTRVGLGLGIAAAGLAGGLAAGHRPLDGGNFEFGHVGEHSGTVVGQPVPMLRPADGREPWPLLVATGKHGADDLVRGLEGREVAVQATRISRGDREMLEVAEVLRPRLKSPPPTSARPRDVRAGPQSGPPETTVSLTGEIVDSKCFLGVMVPGEGITHRGCAALCLRGGIPAALHVKRPDGSAGLYLIAGSTATRDQAIAWAGEVVEMTGTVTQQGGWQVLTSEPHAWRRHER